MIRTESSIATRPVLVEAHGTKLQGDLTLAAGAPGVVIFAHGSGSSRRSPRNCFVADLLTEAGLGTLLFDLLTSAEESDRRNAFDIPLLARRLVGATQWLARHPDAVGRSFGYFGASTGAAAALVAAASGDAPISAVVSRGGRPDLAGGSLSRVKAPTLLIVGGWDTEVLQLNRAAYDQLNCLKQLQVVPGATHLFEEPGTLRTVAVLATDWFLRHLGAKESAAEGHPPV